MTKEEMIAMLKAGMVEEFNTYCMKNPEEEIDLSDTDLSGALLSGVCLKGADLGGANLSRASLGGADLGFAQLNEANLSNAFLQEANLECADLSDADLREATLLRAILSEADMRNAKLTGCRGLEEAVLFGVRWDNAIGVRREIVQASMLVTQSTITFTEGSQK